MRYCVIACVVLTLMQVGFVFGADLDADRIVSEADKIRFPKDPFEIEAEMVTRQGSGEEEMLRMTVYSKGPEKVLAEFTYPRREAGKAILLAGDNMWMYLPDLRKALRVSPTQQIMNSNFSNGDILRINFADDYQAKLIRIERVDANDAYQVELLAKKKEATYQKILYWVRKDNFRPLKAEFYSLSGRVMKTLDFVEYADMAGSNRPVKMLMTNPYKKGETSIVTFKKMVIIDLSDNRFNPNLLGKR